MEFVEDRIIIDFGLGRDARLSSIIAGYSMYSHFLSPG